MGPTLSILWLVVKNCTNADWPTSWSWCASGSGRGSRRPSLPPRHPHKSCLGGSVLDGDIDFPRQFRPFYGVELSESMHRPEAHHSEYLFAVPTRNGHEDDCGGSSFQAIRRARTVYGKAVCISYSRDHTKHLMKILTVDLFSWFQRRFRGVRSTDQYGSVCENSNQDFHRYKRRSGGAMGTMAPRWLAQGRTKHSTGWPAFHWIPIANVYLTRHIPFIAMPHCNCSGVRQRERS